MVQLYIAISDCIMPVVLIKMDAKVVYTTPPAGRVSTNLYDEDDNIPLQIDYRVNWVNFINTLYLNTRTGGNWWGNVIIIGNITTTPGTLVTIYIGAGQNAFTITLNGKQVATYNYRINKPVTKI